MSDIPQTLRVQVTVPKEIIEEFLEECYVDVRTYPDMIAKALVAYYRTKRRGKLEERLREDAGFTGPEAGQIPVYGPTDRRLADATKERQSGDAGPK